MHARWPFPCAWQNQPSGSTDGLDPCADQVHTDVHRMESRADPGHKQTLLEERTAVSAHPRAAEGLVKAASESGRM